MVRLSIYKSNKILFWGATVTGVLSFISVVALLSGKVTVAVAALPIIFHVVYIVLILGKNFKLGKEGIEVTDDSDDENVCKQVDGFSSKKNDLD